MQETAQHKFNAPIPGESLTHELGARPWQKPAQYSDINEVINYYNNPCYFYLLWWFNCSKNTQR